MEHDTRRCKTTVILHISKALGQLFQAHALLPVDHPAHNSSTQAVEELLEALRLVSTSNSAACCTHTVPGAPRPVAHNERLLVDTTSLHEGVPDQEEETPVHLSDEETEVEEQRPPTPLQEHGPSRPDVLCLLCNQTRHEHGPYCSEHRHLILCAAPLCTEQRSERSSLCRQHQGYCCEAPACGRDRGAHPRFCPHHRVYA
jgi:hypothetical protein